MPKMNSYASFDLYLAAQSARNQKIIRALRAFVKRTSPELVESVKYGNGCWLNGKVPAAYVYADTDWVQFGFLRGSSLEDPKKLLEGQGQWVRHVKVRATTDIDPQAFGALLRQAAQYDTLPGRPKSPSKPKAKPKAKTKTKTKTKAKTKKSKARTSTKATRAPRPR